MITEFWPVVFIDHGKGMHAAYIRTDENGLRFVSYHSQPTSDDAAIALEDAEKMGIIPTKAQKPDFQPMQKLNWRPGNEPPKTDKQEAIVFAKENDFFCAVYDTKFCCWERDLESYPEYEPEEIKFWITFEDLAKTLPQP